MADQNKTRLSRRDFIATGVGTAAGAAVVAGVPPIAAATAGDETPRINGMVTRSLPRSGKVVPIFGFGAAPISPGYAPHLSHQQRVDILKYAYDRGVRYFDTASSYRSEDVVGEALEDVRDEVYINTKISSSRGVEDAATRLEQSYKLLRTEVIDCVKVHVPDDYDEGMRVVDLLEKHKAQGRITNIGMSNHIHFEVAFRMIDTGRLDEVLLARCYFPKGMVSIISRRNGTYLDMCIARAHDLGMNVIGMKAMGGWIFSRHSGMVVSDYDKAAVDRLPAAAIRWAFADPRFHLYAIGIGDNADIDKDVKICSEDLAVTNEDRLLLADFTARVWESDFAKTWPEVYRTADSTVDEEKIDAAYMELAKRIREVNE